MKKLLFVLAAVLLWKLYKEEKENVLDQTLWWYIIKVSEKDKLTAGYSLKDINKPVGVSEYKLLEDIPEYLESQFPKVEDIELHINNI